MKFEDLLVLFTFVGALIALVYAVITAKRVLGFSEGTDKMKKIASAIRAGANAYLKRQYKVVIIFFACMFAILAVMAALKMLTWYVPFAFVNTPPPTRANSAIEEAPIPNVSIALVISLAVQPKANFKSANQIEISKRPKPTTVKPITEPAENATRRPLFKPSRQAFAVLLFEAVAIFMPM